MPNRLFGIKPHVSLIIKKTYVLTVTLHTRLFYLFIYFKSSRLWDVVKMIYYNVIPHISLIESDITKTVIYKFTN